MLVSIGTGKLTCIVQCDLAYHQAKQGLPMMLETVYIRMAEAKTQTRVQREREGRGPK